MLTALLAMPSTALAHPSVAAGDVEGVQALRDAIASLLAGRSPWDPVVVAAADPAAVKGAIALEPQGGLVHLGGLGLPQVAARVGRPPLDIPNGSGHPGADLAVLAALVAHHWPAARISVIGLPAVPDDTAGLADAVIASDEPMTVVVAADLAAGHGTKPPRPVVGADRAAAFDAAVVDALDDPDALGALAAEAQACGARGLAGLFLAARVARLAGWSATDVAAHRTAGVGSITARWA